MVRCLVVRALPAQRLVSTCSSLSAGCSIRVALCRGLDFTTAAQDAECSAQVLQVWLKPNHVVIFHMLMLPRARFGYALDAWVALDVLLSQRQVSIATALYPHRPSSARFCRCLWPLLPLPPWTSERSRRSAGTVSLFMSIFCGLTRR